MDLCLGNNGIVVTTYAMKIAARISSLVPNLLYMEQRSNYAGKLRYSHERPNNSSERNKAPSC